MVMPLADDNSDRRTFPYVNIALIAINVLVYVFFQGMGENDRFTYAWSTVPYEIMTGEDAESPSRVVRDPATGRSIQVLGLQHTPISVYLTLLTSMFMHGGLAHIAGNMLFLWIFGDNVEDAIGHVRYVIFYLLCGLIASLCHVFLTVALRGLDSEAALVPSLGASGAISGVLGAYLLLFPHKTVTVIMLRFLTQVPAWMAVGMWFALQLIEGMGMLGGDRGSGGGVAYAAHIGGFVAGMALIFPFRIGVDVHRWADGPRWHHRDSDNWYEYRGR